MKRAAFYRFRLYIAGDTTNSLQATANLAALCEVHLPGRCEMEVIDVLRDPARALRDSVFLTPSLLKLAPLPARRIVGTLGQTEIVLEALGLKSLAA